MYEKMYVSGLSISHGFNGVISMSELQIVGLTVFVVVTAVGLLLYLGRQSRVNQSKVSAPPPATEQDDDDEVDSGIFFMPIDGNDESSS